MYRTGHWGAALLAYAPLGFVVFVAGFQWLAGVGGACAIALGTLPDIDHRLPGVAHRGPTHTVWFALLVGLVVGVGAVVVVGRGAVAGLGVFLFAFLVATVSIVSHIGADALTPMGITPFVPLSDDHYTYDVTPAKNPLANALLLGVGVAATGVALAAALWITGG
jgi:inner membrane protein